MGTRWAPSLGVKRLRREADHSLPSSAEVKVYMELYLCSPNTPSCRGVQLKKAQGQIYFLFYPHWNSCSEIVYPIFVGMFSQKNVGIS